jgi:hypothetical protein
VLDECPYYGDKPLEHDGTGHAEQVFLYEMSSFDDEETIQEHLALLKAESAPIDYFLNKICNSLGV